MIDPRVFRIRPSLLKPSGRTLGRYAVPAIIVKTPFSLVSGAYDDASCPILRGKDGDTTGLPLNETADIH